MPVAFGLRAVVAQLGDEAPIHEQTVRTRLQRRGEDAVTLRAPIHAQRLRALQHRAGRPAQRQSFLDADMLAIHAGLQQKHVSIRRAPDGLSKRGSTGPHHDLRSRRERREREEKEGEALHGTLSLAEAACADSARKTAKAKTAGFIELSMSHIPWDRPPGFCCS